MNRNVHPRKARNDYFDARRGSIKESSLRSYEYPTKHFVEFLGQRGIDSMQDVDGYVLQQWILDRKADDIKPITVHNNVKHVARFIRWCESSEIVPQGVADKMEIPEVSDAETTSDDILGPDTAETIITYLEQYEYATRQHALISFLWHTGCRVSAAMSLDVDDFVPREGYVSFRDRKTAGTPLKNGEKSERNVTLSRDVQNVLTDYIEARRHDVTDDHGRSPLFSTQQGRASRQIIYKNTVGITRPCVYTNDCPHNRDIQGCDAAQQKRAAMQCPSSTSMHPIRRGSITYHLNQGWPVEKVSERCDVSVEVLEKHYDARTEEDKRQGRREYVDEL